MTQAFLPGGKNFWSGLLGYRSGADFSLRGNQSSAPTAEAAEGGEGSTAKLSNDGLGRVYNRRIEVVRAIQAAVFSQQLTRDGLGIGVLVLEFDVVSARNCLTFRVGKRGNSIAEDVVAGRDPSWISSVSGYARSDVNLIHCCHQTYLRAGP